ncbi:MAG: glycosyltransferase family 2 protein [Lachnospiraceae bacterium]|nr:glycosyltransferase family 2 protein [Lachnospiraceae bacterium]
MAAVSVVIPNYNGIHYYRDCLEALRRQKRKPDKIIVIDNGSADGSAEAIASEFPEVELRRFSENTGFCGAVNEGIRASEGMDYVILLNNDTRVEPDFTGELVRAISKNENIFSAQAKMLKMDDKSLADDVGDFYCAFGWAFARGKGKPEKRYGKAREIFSACAGAAIYSMRILKEIGLFDENHFAYLEDTDIGWRARIHGYSNVFAPRARVLHVGSATSGSVYNLFKVLNTSRNSIYLVYKNMPAGQILLNFPLLVFGFSVKALFFARRGFGREYLKGLINGIGMCRKGKKEGKKLVYRPERFPSYFRIQCELWVNCLRRLLG